MEHAGRAVVFSGTTVAIALLSLVLLPVPFLRSIGIAGLFIPLVSVAVAITLLPVVLATVGPRLDWPRARRADRSGRLWTAWARIVVRHRWPAALASGAVLLALAGVAFSIQLGDPRAESLAQSGPARAGFEKLEASGIGAGPLSPFEALVRGGDPDAVADDLAAVDGVRAAVAPREWRRDGTAIVAVIPAEDGNSAEGRATLDRIRSAAPAGVTIGGEAAQSSDFVDVVYGKFPLLVALIAGLTFILLARAFRSLVLSLQAVVLNVISVGAAWGAMVLIWQNGLGSEAIWGIEATRAINVEMPIVVFAFLFGVSMDYQVFIISRMREAYDRTGSTPDGRRRGHRPHRPAGDERGADPRPRVHRVEREPGHRGQDLRHRARGGHPDRRDDRARHPRAGGGGDPRPLELVAPAPAGADAAGQALARPGRGGLTKRQHVTTANSATPAIAHSGLGPLPAGTSGATVVPAGTTARAGRCEALDQDARHPVPAAGSPKCVIEDRLAARGCRPSGHVRRRGKRRRLTT